MVFIDAIKINRGKGGGYFASKQKLKKKEQPVIHAIENYKDKRQQTIKQTNKQSKQNREHRHLINNQQNAFF